MGADENDMLMKRVHFPIAMPFSSMVLTDPTATLEY
jgi:hypothetical protein